MQDIMHICLDREDPPTLVSGKTDGPAAPEENDSSTWNQYANANLFLTRRSSQLVL